MLLARSKKSNSKEETKDTKNEEEHKQMKRKDINHTEL
jgi:hypothetical protein